MDMKSPTITQTDTAIQNGVAGHSDDVVEQFLAHLKTAGRSPATVHAYGIGLTTFKIWFEEHHGGAFTTVAITPLDVELFRDWLRDSRRFAPASINNYLTGVRAFLAWAVDAGIVTSNVAAQVRGVKTSEPNPRWLGQQEQYQLIRTCDELVQLGERHAAGNVTAPGNVWPKRNAAAVRLMLAAGLSLAEVCALDVEDVLLRERSGWVNVRNGRGARVRQVELDKDARKALQIWLDVHPLRPTGGAWATHTPLFVAQKGYRRLNGRSLADRIRVIATRARVGGVHSGTLRHTYAKNLIDASVAIETVAKLLGHTNLETTLIYARSFKGDLSCVIEPMSQED